MTVAPDPRGTMPMRGPRSVWLVATLGVALLAAAVGAQALEGLGGTLAAGEAHYAEVTQVDSSGLLAGLITEESSLLGVTVDQRPVASGWIIAHPDTVEPGQTARVVDDIPFDDPNGGTWLEREVEIDGETAWAVPVDVARYDPTLKGEYNFALVVDWDDVPEDATLQTTYVDHLALIEDA